MEEYSTCGFIFKFGGLLQFCRLIVPKTKGSKMTTIIVLFNLKAGVKKSDYKAWAKNTDLKIVRNLGSIDRFDVFENLGLLGSDAKPPYEYVEMLVVNDMDVFGKETSSDTMASVAAQFQELADNPIFMMTKNIED